MSIKTYYANESDIPENLKGAYIAKNGRYELGKLESDHPSIVALDEIKIKHDTLRTQNGELIEVQTRLESKLLPDGQIPVDKKELESLKTENESYKSLGNLDEIKPKIEGYDALKTETETAKRRELQTKAFTSAGITNLNAAFNLKQSDLLELESEVKDGKEIFYAVTKDDGKVSKRVFDGDYLKEADGFKDSLPALVGETGHKHFKQGTTTTTGDTNLAETHMRKRYTGVSQKT